MALARRALFRKGENMTESFLKDPGTEKEATIVDLSFVQVKFTDRENSKAYTYRVEPDADVSVGQHAITRRNLSKVTIVAVDADPVPNLPLDKYDFVDPVPLASDEDGESPVRNA
jgi:hypothetical protein